MDCTAAKSHMLDEVFDDPADSARLPGSEGGSGAGGLDAETSVALANHLADCASCSEELRQLQAFRGDFVIPAVEVPAGLTERIMARVDEAAAKKAAAPALAVVPSAAGNAPRQPWLRSLAPVVSRAGAWAMRPQTAMAAVFVLMVGSSAWLLGRGHTIGASENAAQELEQGAPLDSPPAAAPTEFDPEAARGAHGLAGTGAYPKPMAAAPGPAAPPQAAPGQAATGDFAFGPEGRAKRERSVASEDDQSPVADELAKKDEARAESEKKLAENAEPQDKGRSLGETAAKSATPPGSGFAAAMQLYRSSRWDDATAAFEALARQGDGNAELWAARSVREGHGCRTALTRFDHLAGTALGTPAGNDATLEGGICYRNLGQIESSTQRFQRLLAFEGYSAKARAEIETNHRILVARKEAQAAAAAGGGGAAARSAPKAPAKPATQPAADSHQP